MARNGKAIDYADARDTMHDVVEEMKRTFRGYGQGFTTGEIDAVVELVKLSRELVVEFAAYTGKASHELTEGDLLSTMVDVAGAVPDLDEYLAD